MSWQMLPKDITVYILKIRNNIRYTASKKIQNAWRKYILPEEIAKHLALEIETNQYDKIIVTISSTALKLKYCLSMCSGNHYLSFWKTVAIKLEDSFNTYDRFTDEEFYFADEEWLTPEAVNYRKIILEYKKLLNKFNYFE